MRAGERGSVAVEVAAAPEVVYDLVADVSRMGEWSPETVEAHWIDGATGPRVGARFKGKNRIGVARWSTKPRITVADRGRELAFVTEYRGRENTRWTYRFAPSDVGTEVTESFEVLDDTPRSVEIIEQRLFGIRDRRAHLLEGMRQTLERLKAAAEAT